MQDTALKTDGIPVLTRTLVISAIVATLFGPTLAMALFARSLTPDIVYRWTAEGWSGTYGLTGIALAAIVAALPMVVGQRTDSLKSAWGMTLGWTIFVFTIGTGIAAVDLEGSHNPYTRAKPASAWQYADLASARRYPAVAAQIREAASDGVMTTGEAHDILNGDVLRKAENDAARVRLDRARADVLTLR